MQMLYIVIVEVGQKIVGIVVFVEKIVIFAKHLFLMYWRNYQPTTNYLYSQRL